MPEVDNARRHRFTVVGGSCCDARIKRSMNYQGAKQAVRSMAGDVIAIGCLMYFLSSSARTSTSPCIVCGCAFWGLRPPVTYLAISRVLGLGALLHDIGMVKVPEEILGKPEALTPASRADEAARRLGCGHAV
jgi:hypothetical protein